MPVIVDLAKLILRPESSSKDTSENITKLPLLFALMIGWVGVPSRLLLRGLLCKGEEGMMFSSIRNDHGWDLSPCSFVPLKPLWAIMSLMIAVSLGFG